MTTVTRFWTPFTVFTNLKSACFAIVVYTIAFAMVVITMTRYMMSGGDSTQMYFPFFENNVRDSLQFYGKLTVLYMIYMIVSGCFLVHGVIVSLRGFLLPWLFGMFFIVLFLIVWSVWLLYGYYIYIQIIIPAIIYWILAAYNFYCWLCVYTQYKIIARLQSPNIELIYP